MDALALTFEQAVAPTRRPPWHLRGSADGAGQGHRGAWARISNTRYGASWQAFRITVAMLTSRS